MSIIERAYEITRSKRGTDLEHVSIVDIRIGRYLTAVTLSDESIGICSSFYDSDPFCQKPDRDFGDFSPLRIKGKMVKDLFESFCKVPALKSIRLAVLNALASANIESGNYLIIDDKDPIDLVDLSGERTITVVGAFPSYIRRISSTRNTLHVLELEEGRLQPEHRMYFRKAEDFASVFDKSDIIVITGQTLVNDTFDSLSKAIPESTKVILTGASGGLIPEALFENKIDIIGTLKITRPDLLFQVVQEGGIGYHLFEYCARKICILKPDEEPVK
ncbi:MAG: DUF364 domain-containing protein [Bacteroidales bacterium]